jgi:4-carboxymuconolactone decarboxylase
MTDKFEAGRRVVQKMLPEHANFMDQPPDPSRFAPEFSRIAFENAFAQLWAREGLSLRDRSVLTLGILITLGNQSELKAHLGAARRNGLTLEEVEEVLYHATAYAGFPLASTARAVAAELFSEEAARRTGG